MQLATYMQDCQLIICMDVHSIAIIRAAENYQNLEEGFDDAFTEINELMESFKVAIYEEIYIYTFTFCLLL